MAGGLPENAQKARSQLVAGAPALVWRKLVADTETPVGAALKLIEPGRGDFLLESVEGGEVRGRYTPARPRPRPDVPRHRQCLRDQPQVALRPGRLRAAARRQPRGIARAGRLLPDRRARGPAPALACLVGYFGYETIGLVEDLPRAPQSKLELPDMLFARPALICVFDRLSDDLFCIAPLWAGSGDPDAAIAAAGERIDEALRKLAAPAPKADVIPDLPAMALEPVMDAADYERIVLAAKDYITAGDIFQVVLAQRFTCPFPLPPLALYRALRRVNPSPFLYFLDLPGFAVVGSSPEILVRVRDGEVTIRPIAGTRPRGATREADEAAEASLLADPKECAEHLMLLDLGRNDVGRVAAADSVQVTASFTVERYSHVMHIVSNVVGKLDPSKDALDALFAGFPAGTVSGAPKVRACQIIAELEPETRGPYAGGVGYFAPDGSVDSLHRPAHRGGEGRGHARAGRRRHRRRQCARIRTA